MAIDSFRLRCQGPSSPDRENRYKPNFIAGLLISAGPILGNLPFVPEITNQALTLIAILLLVPEIRDAVSKQYVSLRTLGIATLGLGSVALHLLVVAETTGDKTFGIQQILRTLIIILPLCLAFFALARKGRAQTLLTGMIVGALLGAPTVFLGGSSVDNSYIAVGQILSVASLLAFCNRNWKMTWRLSAGIYLAVSTFTAGSRGAFLAILLGILVILALGKYASTTSRILYLTTFLCLITLVGFSSIDNAFNNVAGTLAGTGDQSRAARQSGVLNPSSLLKSGSTETRKEEELGPAIARIKERPFIGFGFGASSKKPPALRSYPHNVFIELALNFGSVGALAGLAGLILFSSLVVRNSTTGNLAAAASLSALIFTAQVSGSLTVNRMLWVFAALAVGNLKYNHDSKNIDTSQMTARTSFGRVNYAGLQRRTRKTPRRGLFATNTNRIY